MVVYGIPCQMLWSVDAQPEKKAQIAQEIATRWVPCRLSQMLPAASHATAAMDPGLYKHPDRAGGSAAEGMGHPTPLGAGGGRAGDGKMPRQGKDVLSRHDVGKLVFIDLSFNRDAKCKGKRDDTAHTTPPQPAHLNPDTCSQMHTYPPLSLPFLSPPPSACTCRTQHGACQASQAQTRGGVQSANSRWPE